MGQQQQLLLVLGIVIVGLAVVSGVSAFSENQRKSTLDAYIQEVVTVGSGVIEWQLKPRIFGGNGSRSDLSAISLVSLGREQTSGNANVSRRDYADRQLRVNSANSSRPLVDVRSTPVTDGSVHVQLAIGGAAPECMVQRSRIRSGSSWGSWAGSTDQPKGCSW